MHPERPIRNNTLTLLAGIALITLLGVFGLRYLLRDKVVVRVAHASYQDLNASVSTNGKVEPEHDFEAHSGPGGTVQHVYVTVGQQVKAGQLLVVMSADDARARVAQSDEQVHAAQLALQSVKTGGTQADKITLNNDLANAQQQYHQAQVNLSSIEKLHQNGAASAAEVASAQQRVQTSQNALSLANQRQTSNFSSLDVAHAQSALAEAEANRAAALSNLKTVEIRAPFDGTVYSVAVSNFDFVAAGDTLVEMADLNHLRVRAYFDEPEIGKLAVGQTARITWDGKPGLAWHGHVTQVPDTVITYGTRTVGEVLVSVDDSDGNLLPNTNVNVTVTTLSRQHVLTVPREALHTEGRDNYVYVINEHTLAKRAIQIGGVNLIQVEVTDGLNPGDAVALTISGAQTLSDMMHVDSFQ